MALVGVHRVREFDAYRHITGKVFQQLAQFIDVHGSLSSTRPAPCRSSQCRLPFERGKGAAVFGVTHQAFPLRTGRKRFGLLLGLLKSFRLKGRTVRSIPFLR